MDNICIIHNFFNGLSKSATIIAEFQDLILGNIINDSSSYLITTSEILSIMFSNIIRLLGLVKSKNFKKITFTENKKILEEIKDFTFLISSMESENKLALFGKKTHLYRTNNFLIKIMLEISNQLKNIRLMNKKK